MRPKVRMRQGLVRKKLEEGRLREIEARSLSPRSSSAIRPVRGSLSRKKMVLLPSCRKFRSEYERETEGGEEGGGARARRRRSRTHGLATVRHVEEHDRIRLLRHGELRRDGRRSGRHGRNSRGMAKEKRMRTMGGRRTSMSLY